MCEDLTWFSMLKCSLTGLWSKLQTCYKKERQGDTQEHRRTYYRNGEIRVYRALHSLQTTRNSESNSPRDVCTRWQGVQEARAHIACDPKGLQLLQFRNWCRRCETEILATTNLLGAVKWYRNGGFGEHQRGWHGDRFVHWSLSSSHEKLPQALQVSYFSLTPELCFGSYTHCLTTSSFALGSWPKVRSRDASGHVLHIVQLMVALCLFHDATE